jgi:hypothetical protein
MAGSAVPASKFTPYRASLSETDGESDEDSLDHTPAIRIRQVAKSRPESSILEIVSDYKQPESLRLSGHDDSLQDSPRLEVPPSPPLPLLQQEYEEVFQEGLKPPSGFHGMIFKIKKRPRGGLGITVAACEEAHTGLFMVRRITPNGTAAKDGRLQVGDRLVSVNGVNLLNMAHAAVLQALNEARKEVVLAIWRDPHHNLASSSMHSLGSNWSGSRSSLLSEDDGSPSSGPVKRHHTRGLPVSTPRDSPLATRFSYAGIPASPPRTLIADKRWSDGNVLAALRQKESIDECSTDVQEDGVPDLPKPLNTMVSDLFPPDPKEDLPETIPPDIPEVTPPETPPEFLDAKDEVRDKSELPALDLPVSPYLPATVIHGLPEAPEAPTTLPPAEVFPEVTSTLPEIPSTITPSGSPKIPPTESPIIWPTEPSPTSTPWPNNKREQAVDSRPPSLQVPRGERAEKTPFEIELKKGLSGIGVGLTVNDVDMLVISSLSPRSVVSQDGNIR